MFGCVEAVLLMTDNDITHAIIGAAIEVHRALGPGLLEATYATCLAREFELRGLHFEKEKALPVVYKEVHLECGYRADFVVEGRIIVELKAVEALAPVHEAIVLTYLRLSGCRIGLLMNFNTTVLKDGIRRFVWDYQPVEEPTSKGETPAMQRKNRNA